MEEPPPLILHVIHHLVIGGMENGVVNLINGLSPLDFRHAIVCIEDFSEFRYRLRRQDVEVIALRRSERGIWGTRCAIYRLCKRLRPAIVHSRNLSGLDALLPARLAGVRRLVHGEHGWDIDDLKGTKVRQTLLRKLHRPFVSRYVVVSRDLENYLVNRVGVSPSRVTQIYNGVDTRRFHPRQERALDLPVHIGCRGKFVIGTVGRLQPVKDQQTLLRAVAKLLADEPDKRAYVRLVLVGDGPLSKELQELAESLGIADITWFAGARHDVEEQLHQFDLFVLPSLNEGISNTILEAMASGLPIIATGVGGNPELIAGCACGTLVGPGDVAGFASALSRYVRDPQLTRAAGHAGRTRAETQFSLDAMIARYAKVYRQMLQPRGEGVSRATMRDRPTA